MVAGRLAGRVGAVRFVLVGFGEGRIVSGERAVNFVGGDMQETEFVFGRFFELTVVGTYGLKQAEGTDDIGLDEVFRAVNAAVDMRFSGEVDDSARLVLGQQSGDQVKVANAPLTNRCLASPSSEARFSRLPA
jgi:hypothetical protein